MVIRVEIIHVGAEGVKMKFYPCDEKLGHVKRKRVMIYEMESC